VIYYNNESAPPDTRCEVEHNKLITIAKVTEPKKEAKGSTKEEKLHSETHTR